jgi:hypothetical protein
MWTNAIEAGTTTLPSAPSTNSRNGWTLAMEKSAGHHGPLQAGKVVQLRAAKLVLTNPPRTISRINASRPNRAQCLSVKFRQPCVTRYGFLE